VQCLKGRKDSIGVFILRKGSDLEKSFVRTMMLAVNESSLLSPGSSTYPSSNSNTATA